jgi:hypothetical protein
MRANTIWGLFVLAAAVILAVLTPAQTSYWRPYLLAIAAACFVAGVITLIWPFFSAPSRMVRALTADERYLMAAEGVVLRRTTFGPFPHDDGNYGHMPWDRVHAVVNRLIDLGLVRVSTKAGTRGQYAWTWLGRRVLRHLTINDANPPD